MRLKINLKSIFAIVLVLSILACDDSEPSLFGEKNTVTVIIHGGATVYQIDGTELFLGFFQGHPHLPHGLILRDREESKQFELNCSAIVAGEQFETSRQSSFFFSAAQIDDQNGILYYSLNTDKSTFGSISNKPCEIYTKEFLTGDQLELGSFFIKKLKLRATFPVSKIDLLSGQAPTEIANATVLIHIDR
jgi:hypothetical protein